LIPPVPARAEIAKVFKARVAQASQDTASEASSKKGVESSFATQTRTSVSTDEVLEGVEIADTYIDDKKKTNYALAVLDKVKLRNSLSQKILDQEEIVKSQTDISSASSNPVEIAKASSKALNALAEIERIAEKKKIVDPAVAPSLYSSQKTEIENRLQSAKKSIIFIVEPYGDTTLNESVSSRISKLGFSAVSLMPEKTGSATYIIARCKTALSPIERNNPQWKFYSWRATVELVDNANNNVILASGTKEGQASQLNDDGARAKALQAALQGAASCAEEKIREYILGE